MDGVKVPSGGYARLEDFCNRQERGSHFHYCASIVRADEELFGIENGWRVLDAVLTYAIECWDALMDRHYAEYCAHEYPDYRRSDPAQPAVGVEGDEMLLP